MCITAIGCAKGEGKYVDGSFGYNNLVIYEYSEALSVNISFEVELSAKGKYEIDYVVLLISRLTGEVLNEERVHNNITTNEKIEEIHNSLYMNVKCTASAADFDIKDIKIKYVGDETGYEKYAIGFGVTGAVLVVGLVGLFILNKTGVLGKKKK